MPGSVIRPVLSTIQIQKLGHKLEEIRLRALNSIVSKLEHGFVSEKELAAQKDLVVKLLDWFNFETCPEAEKVLNLILRLIKADAGGAQHVQVKAQGGHRALDAVRTKVDPKLQCLIDEIVNEVNRCELHSDLTDTQDSSCPSTFREQPNQTHVGMTVTPIYIEAKEQGSEDLQSSPVEIPQQSNHGYFTSGNAVPAARIVAHSQQPRCFKCLLLPWQPLVATDRHVLVAVEESLASTTDLPLILHTCQFFTDVMLRDFPAEVFLQRPPILKMFLELLDSDRRLCEAVACCLCKLTAALRVRVHYYSDPGIANLKQAICSRPDSDPSSPSYTSHHSSSTSSTGRPIVGQYLNSDIAQNNHDSTQFQAYQQNVSKEASCSSEATEDSVLLQLQQFSLPQYCLLCLFHTVPHFGPSSGLQRENPALLAAELVHLFAMCVKPSIWSSSDPVAQEVSQHLKQVLILVGEVLEKYRSVGVKEESNRLTYLQLLALARKLLVTAVPVSIADSILHAKLKNALSRSLIDLSVIALFPEVHADILQYVKAFQTSSDADYFLNYDTAMTICASMKAAVRFLKNHDKLEKESFEVLDESLPSLSFHGNLDIVRNCVEIAVNKLYHMSLDDSGRKVVTSVILKLLAHADPHVKLEMYGCCHKYVVVILGVQQVSRMSVGSSRPLDFLCDTAVLIEIISHGAASIDKKIQKYSEEMLIHLLKGKFILSEPAWQQFLECLIPALPLLQCYADQTTSLGRAIVKIFDPETSQSIQLPRGEVLKGNLRLLFCSDPLTREEAISRITWLMAREERSYEKLPDFSSLRGLLLNSVCLMDRPVDLGHRRTQQHFYQVSSLCQVMELLRCKGIQPVVRRSALSQISVMLEDSNLHDQFLKQDGLSMILDILHKALVDREYNSYPDSVIPCVSALKNLVLYSPKLRQELSHNVGLFSCIVRAVYLYSGDDRLRPDSSVLLCLLLYSDFILSVPEPANISSPWHCFSLPDLVVRHMRLPFLCHTHWHSSPHTQLSEKRDLLKHEDCYALLRLCWNVEWFGGLEVILSWSEVPPTFDTMKEGKLLGFAEELRLLEGDLNCLKATAVAHRCKQHLYDIQNATTHQAVLKSLTCITGYLALHMLVNGKMNCQMKSTSNFFDASQLQSFDWWHGLPWAETFKRFLGIPPACPEDQQLLVSVLKLLRLCLNTCWRSERGAGEQKYQPCWVAKLLKDSTQPLPNLLLRSADTSGGTDGDNIVLKELCREILQLVQECSVRERKLEDTGNAMLKKCGEDNTSGTAGSWIHIIHAVTRNLTFSDTQHFYNLAFLDWMLSCLAHLTSIPGWSDHGDGSVHHLWSEQISCLVELVTAFHCGKGGDSLASFMGLSITRSAVLCMNHLLCEMQHCTNSKGWETTWLCSLGAETHAAGHANLTWLPPLWLSRDPVVRSAALQLVAGFCSSRRGCGLLLSGLPTIAGGVWGAGLSFLLDHEEACLVREQAAALLTNVSSYSISTSGGGTALSQCHIAVNSEEAPLTGIQALQSLLSQCNFYGEIAKVLSWLYMGSAVDPSGVNGANGWTVESLCDGPVPPETELQPHQWALLYHSSCKSSCSIEYEGSSAPTGSSQLEPHMKTTPGLVKTVCWLMVNMIALNPDDSLRHINGFGLIRLLLSCLVTGVPQEYGHSSNVLLYVDILEMYTGICCVLSRCVSLDEACHSTVLHTHDCVHSLLALLDPVMYSTHSAQLVFLRNRLWSELFQLFSALLSGKQGFETIRDALFHCGPWRFFATLMTAIENELSTNLHQSALTCLTSLLSNEIRTRSLSEEINVVQNLLDSYFPVPEEEDRHTTQYILLKRLVLPLQQASSDHNATACQNKPVMYSKHSNKDNRNMSEADEHMLPSSKQKKVSPQSQAAANKNKSESSRRKTYQKNNSLDHAFTSDEHKEKLFSDTNGLPSIRTEPEGAIAKNQTVGAELCNLLLRQYEIHKLMQGSAHQRSATKGRMLVTCALSSLLAVSGEAKKAALNQGLLETLVIQLRELHIKLSLESAESLHRTSDKKRVCPVLRDVAVLLAVLTNFLNGDGNVKVAAAEIGLADLVHKLWVWCCALSSLLEAALKMLSTFTTSCISATQSLVMTTTVLGVGLRKTPSSLSLLHEIVSLIHREMEAVNRVHEAGILSLSFQVLTNSCQSQECRNVIAKSNLFQCLAKLHPSITKKQKHWEAVELMWLQFLSDFTFHSEGQQTVPKITDAMDLLILLTRSSKMENRLAALCVLRNISFHQLNRPRLLGSGEFLQVLHQKLADGTVVEKTIAASMVWALVANNQKGKVVIKCSGIDAKLQEALNQLHLLSTNDDIETDEGIRIISSVLQIIHAENSTTRKQ